MCNHFGLTSKGFCIINEEHLGKVVKEIFGKSTTEVAANARKHGNLINPITGKHFELDIWLPDLRLGFEFQDDYHYMTTWYSQLSLSRIKSRDERKMDVACKSEMTLIVVPYWWDGCRESLVETIKFFRPDLLLHEETNSSFYSAIPFNPGIHSFTSRSVPGVGELMSASYPSYLDESFTNLFSPINVPDPLHIVVDTHPWWLGEKYDGIRACWNMITQALFSRVGYPIRLLPSFTCLFPSQFLDAEIWFGRGFFQDSQQLVGSSQVNWPFLRVVAFDVVPSSTNGQPFETRYSVLLRNCGVDHEFTIVAARLLCTNKELLENFMKLILDDGGEGVILRAPKSGYFRGRSDLLIKLKATKGDREGLVIRRFKDGACVIQLPNEVTFIVPPENIRIHYEVLKEGDVITFSYENISRNSVPMNPIVLRKRSDLTWRQVLLYSSSDLPRARYLNEISHKVTSFMTENSKDWITKKRNKMRLFCEKFAESKGMDHRVPGTWYHLARELAQLKEANFILLPYHMSIIKALVDLFPNIGLKEEEFAHVPRNYWDNVHNRREFFCHLGKHFGFDPFIPENWYSASIAEINKFKGVKAILRYDKTIAKALVHLFPEIGFDEHKFPKVPVVHNNWRQRRNFFIEFAKHKGFDPRVADNWYSVSRKSVLRFKEGYTVLQNYRGRLRNALLHLFPNLGLDRSKFAHQNRWKTSSKGS